MITYEQVMSAISPAVAIERVRGGFIAHARGEWSMPPKLYLPSRPYGDFRAMPALGGGIALLKWVTSFPGNPRRGLPTVTGVILLSEAATGEPIALVDARAVTALRTGAAAAVASLALARPEAKTVGVIGCGLHGAWAARCLCAAGYGPGICVDSDRSAAVELAEELGWRVGGPAEALACDVVTTVTPGLEPVITAAELHLGMHINALGADGSGKAEMEVEAVDSCIIFCDEWEQASHGGELTQSVCRGLVSRARVTQLGEVLTGAAPGRPSDDAVTLFDSTGLAIQDLAIAHALLDAVAGGGIGTNTIDL